MQAGEPCLADGGPRYPPQRAGLRQGRWTRRARASATCFSASSHAAGAVAAARHPSHLLRRRLDRAVRPSRARSRPVTPVPWPPAPSAATPARGRAPAGRRLQRDNTRQLRCAWRRRCYSAPPAEALSARAACCESL